MRAHLIALLLVPVMIGPGCVRRVAAPAPDGMQPDEVPEGQVALSVVSADHRVWSLRLRGEVVCQTPCTEYLGSYDSFAVESDENEGIFVPSLPPEAIDARRALVVAEGQNRAKHVNGIVFTALGGMAGVVGITFTAVGCSDLERRAGLCTAGLITGGVALPLTALSIWMLIDSFPKVHILPVPGGGTSKPSASVLVTPVGLAGTF